MIRVVIVDLKGFTISINGPIAGDRCVWLSDRDLCPSNGNARVKVSAYVAGNRKPFQVNNHYADHAAAYAAAYYQIGKRSRMLMTTYNEQYTTPNFYQYSEKVFRPFR